MSETTWSIGHLDNLESPWGNAGGVIKSVEEVEAMAKTGVGWIEAGSYCMEKRYGNAKDSQGNPILAEGTDRPIRVDHYDQATGEAYNSWSMPGQGLDQLVTEIPEMNRIAEAHNKKVVFNFAPVSDDPVSETQEGVTRLFDAGAPAVLVNGGCPNVKDKIDPTARHEILSLNARMTYLVLHGLCDIVEKYHKVFFRGSPQPSYDTASIVYNNIKKAGTVSTVWLPNSWGNQMPLYDDGTPILEVPGNIGGKTGPAMADEAAKQVGWGVNIFNGSGIKTVGSSGIKDAPEIGRVAAVELKRQMDLGAIAGSGSSFYVWPDEGWKKDTERMLNQFANLA